MKPSLKVHRNVVGRQKPAAIHKYAPANLAKLHGQLYGLVCASKQPRNSSGALPLKGTLLVQESVEDLQTL